MDLADSHCHIQDADPSFILDSPMGDMWRRAEHKSPDEILLAAQQVGVKRFMCVGTTVADSQAATRFAANNEDCWASIGLHPHESDGLELALPAFSAMLNNQEEKGGKIVAIGECGLDYHYNHAGPAIQQKALRAQIELAVSHDLPLIFHIREAFDDFWPIFDDYPSLRGVLHSFTGGLAELSKALERNLLIGQNGIVTFTKNAWQLEVAKAIPAKQLLLETDAPFLAPAPKRGTINEPSSVRLIAEFLSILRDESLELIADATTANFRRLFGV